MTTTALHDGTLIETGRKIISDEDRAVDLFRTRCLTFDLAEREAAIAALDEHLAATGLTVERVHQQAAYRYLAKTDALERVVSSLTERVERKGRHVEELERENSRLLEQLAKCGGTLRLTPSGVELERRNEELLSRNVELVEQNYHLARIAGALASPDTDLETLEQLRRLALEIAAEAEEAIGGRRD
jgi:hypothetical protein